MKKILIILIILILCNLITFAEIKTFTKEDESVVQKDQSVNQVIDYLKQKLERQAQEEAGKFITSELNIENKTITKDEFKSFAGSIATTTVLEETPFMKGKEQYVKVKIKADIDTDTVKTYLEKIMQDKKYEEQAKKAIQEAEKIKNEKLELEEKLKKANKKIYEQELSAQVQQQVELQKQRAIELNKMALKAKEEYAKAELYQKQQELKRQEELNILKKQIEQESLQTQQKIAQEKDNIKKAELENQAKIRELENKAKENMINWQQTTTGTTIEQAIEEATKVKQEANELFSKFENLSKTNKQDLIKSYDTQINILKETEFQEKEPVKDTWEKQNEYDERLQKYKKNIKQSKDNINKKIKELNQTKDDNLLKEEMGTLNSTINTTKPFIDKLKYFQTEKFYSKDSIKAKLMSVGEVNVEENYFILNVNYINKEYSLKYDFSKIGREKAKLMCQTQNQFIIEPLFSVNNNLTKELTAFNIKHLGTNLEKNINVVATVNSFDETAKFAKLENDINDKNKKLKNINKLNIKLTNLIKKLPKKSPFIEKSKNVLSLSTYKKIEQFDLFNNYVDTLGNLIIDIVSGDFHIVGLKLNGSVAVIEDNSNNNARRLIGYGHGDSYYENFNDKPCNVNNWKNIKAIFAGHFRTVGLKYDETIVSTDGENYIGNRTKTKSSGKNHRVFLKDGKVFAEGNNYCGQCNVKNWKDIIAISAGYYHTVGLRKDGTVVAAGDNEAGQCDVQNWKDIIAVSAGSYYTVGLRTDGSIVATGLFFTTDIGPGEATDYEFREINHNDYILDKGINLPNFELDSYSNQKNSVGDSKEQKSIEINNKPIEVFETDKNFDSVFYSCDNIILKFNDYIRIYNIATKKFIDFEKAIISYDMKHIAYLKTEKKILYDNIKKTFSCLITFNINTNSIEDIWDLGTKTVKDFIFSTTNILIITKTYYMSSDKYTVHAFSNSKNYETKGPYRGTEYKKYKDFNKNLNKKTYYNYMELNNTELQIVVDKNSIHIKNMNSNETYKTLTLEGQITSANFSNDGKKIIILLNKKKVLIWDILE